MSIISQIGVVILIAFIVLVLIRSNKNLKKASEEGESFVDEWALRQEKKEEIKQKREEKKLEVQKEKNVEPEFKEIYDILNYDEPIHINEIAKKLNLSISEINAKLMMLELEEKIVSLPGNNYKKC